MWMKPLCAEFEVDSYICIKIKIAMPLLPTFLFGTQLVTYYVFLFEDFGLLNRNSLKSLLGDGLQNIFLNSN